MADKDSSFFAPLEGVQLVNFATGEPVEVLNLWKDRRVLIRLFRRLGTKKKKANQPNSHFSFPFPSSFLTVKTTG
jgi:hypothetical protein